MNKTTWQSVKDSAKATWKEFRAFLRDKFTDEPDLSDTEIQYDWDDEDDLEAFRQDTQDKSDLDMAIATYLDKRMKSIERARSRQRERERVIGR